METAQERELQLQLQGRQAWPFHHAMATSLDASSSSSGSGCFLLGWEPPFGCLGILAADAGVHELFPLYMDSLPVSPAASTAVALAPAAQDATAMPEELDDLLLDFWHASSYGDVAEQQQVASNSSCVLQHEKTSSTATTTTTTTNSVLYDDPLGSIFLTGPTLPGKVVSAEPLLSSSSSSSCHADPRISDNGGAQPQATPKPSVARAPPLPRSSSSLKRATPEEEEAEWCSQSSSKRRKAAPAGVVCPFAVLKPDGLDGGATLADINARILMRPARPVRHPVGEFACAPRVSADKPGISGKTVSGFTRLHTPGRGTITIIRTRG